MAKQTSERTRLLIAGFGGLVLGIVVTLGVLVDGQYLQTKGLQSRPGEIQTVKYGDVLTYKFNNVEGISPDVKACEGYFTKSNLPAGFSDDGPCGATSILGYQPRQGTLTMTVAANAFPRPGLYTLAFTRKNNTGSAKEDLLRYIDIKR